MPANLSSIYGEEFANEYNNATTGAHKDEDNGHLYRRAGGTATMGTCPAYFLDMSGYSSTSIGTFFDVKPADQLSPTFGTYNPWPPNIQEDDNGNPILVSAESGGAIFAREHVYEVSMGGFIFLLACSGAFNDLLSIAALFIDHLQQFTELWQITNGP